MAGILDRKVALVTGGASGIGRATAVAMAREGALVAVADRTDESAAGTVAIINAAGGQAMAIGGDVTLEAHVAAMITRTVAAFGRIDCAFNNAGIGGRSVGPAGQRTHELSQPKSPASSSLDNVVPQMIIRSPRVRPGKSVFSEAKRLLQHYLPNADIVPTKKPYPVLAGWGFQRG